MQFIGMSSSKWKSSYDKGRIHNSNGKRHFYGAPFVKILYLTDLAQKVLSLRKNPVLIRLSLATLISWRQSFAKLLIPKLSLHNSAAFCHRKKLRRDLLENLTFYSNMYTLASLNYTLSVSEYAATNVTAKPFTFLRKTNNVCTVVSHTCSCNTLTVTRK